MNLIQQLEKEQVEKLSAGKEIPDFGPGDTVLVNVKVVEGDRTRIQAYEGVCIGRSGARPQRELHRAQDFLRRGRRARVPALLADDQLDQGGAPRQGAPRQALLPARPARQEGAHFEAQATSGPEAAPRPPQGIVATAIPECMKGPPFGPFFLSAMGLDNIMVIQVARSEPRDHGPWMSPLTAALRAATLRVRE